MKDKKVQEKQCRDSLLKLTALVDETFVGSSAINARVSDNGHCNCAQPFKGEIAPAYVPRLALHSDGFLILERGLALCIGALATVAPAKISRTSLAHFARVVAGFQVRVSDLLELLKNFTSIAPYINVLEGGPYPVYELSKEGWELVEFAQTHPVSTLSSILSAHDRQQRNQHLDAALAHLRANLAA